VSANKGTCAVHTTAEKRSPLRLQGASFLGADLLPFIGIETAGCLSDRRGRSSLSGSLLFGADVRDLGIVLRLFRHSFGASHRNGAGETTPVEGLLFLGLDGTILVF
jgi:hypothetical protein